MAVDMVPLIFDIVSSTAIFVLAVLGLGVIASMMGIFNFAHGEFLLIGAYTVYIAQANGLPTWMGMAAAPIVVGVVALALERTIIRRFATGEFVHNGSIGGLCRTHDAFSALLCRAHALTDVTIDIPIILDCERPTR